VVLAFDIQGLVSIAQHTNCVIEMVPQVGDFIAIGDPLFRVYQGGTVLMADTLRESVAVGQERTLEQDPAFTLRILVDIASKGLSPTINDPTTAVLAIDQIHHLLHNLGARRLDDGRVAKGAGAEMRMPLGVAVCSGMLGATFFALVFTPVFYWILMQFASKEESERLHSGAVHESD